MSESLNSNIDIAANVSLGDSTGFPLPTVQIRQGMCYALFAHEVGLAIDLDQAERRITATKQRETISHKRRTPEYFTYDPPPLRVIQNTEPLSLGSFKTATEVTATIYDFGAISVTYRIPLHGPISGLLALSDELYGNAMLLADARHRVEQLLSLIEPAATKPRLPDLVEDYAIYQVEVIEPAVARDQFLAGLSPLLAQILRAERDPLSEQVVRDALACRLSYGGDDMVIVDWNAAILLDTDADDLRAVLEYANVELLEMRYLDNELDKALDESYSVLTRRRWSRRLMFRSQRNDLRRVAELQVDGALLFEGVNNAIKLLGDQYLARVYRATSERLHLNDWDASIIRKLGTLESIYQKISDHAAHRRMEVLEWIIIILIAVSIAVSFIPGLVVH